MHKRIRGNNQHTTTSRYSMPYNSFFLIVLLITPSLWPLSEHRLATPLRSIKRRYRFTDIFQNEATHNRALFDTQSKVWIKPRSEEWIVWRLTRFLGASNAFLPAVPIAFRHSAQTASLQTHIPMQTGHWLLDHAKKRNSVALVTYWQANIMAFILGLDDLNGQNIGIATHGQLFFFDLETCFSIGMPAVTTKRFGADRYATIDTSFASLTFDWPQFTAPLSHRESRAMTHFLDQLNTRLKRLSSRRDIPLTEANREIMEKKIALLYSFPIKEGTSFQDLYFYLFPAIEQHRPMLTALAYKLFRRKQGLGTTLWALKRAVVLHHSEIEQERLQELTEIANEFIQYEIPSPSQ